MSAMDEPMDRSAERRRARLRLGAAGVLALVAVGFGISRLRPGTLYVSRDGLRFGRVVTAPFREGIVVQGTVEPLQLVYLETAYGGRVDEVLLQEGSRVTQGDLILRLVNTDLELEVMRQNDLLQGALERQRETELLVDQARREAERGRLEIEHQLLVKRKDLEVQSKLHEQGLTPDVEFVKAQEEAAFWEKRLALFLEGEERDALFRAAQVREAREAVERRRESFKTAQSEVDRLDIRAPLDGVLTSLDVEVGETKAAGERLGQVDAAGFEIHAQADQTYASRIVEGQEGVVTSSGSEPDETVAVTVSQVFEQVIDGRFRVDLAFAGGEPPGLKRGQRINVRLLLGAGEQSVLVPKGAFHQQTGGRWIFVVDEDGGFAERRDIKLGRQNPDYYEVLAGLADNERVILSRYDGYGDNRRLVFKD